MELKRNEMVLFEDGTTQGQLEARWSESKQAFYDVRYNEYGEPYKVYSTTIIEKPKRRTKKFVPTAKNCTVRIDVIGETSAAYIVVDGTNGLVGKHAKAYKKYIAKSICYTDGSGNVYAPSWA